jgi:hypothetical protein
MEFEDIYKKYLKELKILENPKTERQIESVFLLARNDFFNYQISLDQFSSICEKLHIEARGDINIMTSHLETVLNAGMELSWYVRQRPDENARQLNYFLQAIHDYKGK